MNRILPLIVSLVFTISLMGQENILRFGLQVSPVISWLNSNDNRIEGAGDNAGLRFGILGEKYFQENYALVGAFSLVFDQGGTLNYENGGNFLPKSDLSNPNWNRGDKPLPDDVEIGYHLNFVEAMLGLKLRTNEFGRFRVYTEFPVLYLGVLTRAKGDIQGVGIDTEKERIGKDIRNLALSWGGGAGLEIGVGENLVLTSGLFYQQSFSDMIRNKGNFAFGLVDDNGTPGDPTDDQYETLEENSRARLGSLTIRIGLMF